MEDVDDEVRDRAALYLKVIDKQNLADTYVKEGDIGQIILLIATLLIVIA